MPAFQTVAAKLTYVLPSGLGSSPIAQAGTARRSGLGPGGTAGSAVGTLAGGRNSGSNAPSWWCMSPSTECSFVAKPCCRSTTRTVSSTVESSAGTRSQSRYLSLSRTVTR